jgi:hypothetical protein
MKIFTQKKGQFIIIAALLISIMIISVATVIYGTVTYFRQERWEEYVTVIDSIETSSGYVTEISLAKYSQAQNPTQNQTILRDNLNQWVRDVRKAYPNLGVNLNYILATGLTPAYEITPNYDLGLHCSWNLPVSFSAANASFNLNIASVGLTGYSFTTNSILKMTIADALWYTTGTIGIRVILQAEGLDPVLNLRKENFLQFQVQQNGTWVDKEFTLKRYYESRGHSGYPPLNAFVYELQYSSSMPSGPIFVRMTVRDLRGIQVSGSASLTKIDA